MFVLFWSSVVHALVYTSSPPTLQLGVTSTSTAWLVRCFTGGDGLNYVIFGSSTQIDIYPFNANGTVDTSTSIWTLSNLDSTSVYIELVAYPHLSTRNLVLFAIPNTFNIVAYEMKDFPNQPVLLYQGAGKSYHRLTIDYDHAILYGFNPGIVHRFNITNPNAIGLINSASLTGLPSGFTTGPFSVRPTVYGNQIGIAVPIYTTVNTTSYAAFAFYNNTKATVAAVKGMYNPNGIAGGLLPITQNYWLATSGGTLPTSIDTQVWDIANQRAVSVYPPYTCQSSGAMKTAGIQSSKLVALICSRTAIALFDVSNPLNVTGMGSSLGSYSNTLVTDFCIWQNILFTAATGKGFRSSLLTTDVGTPIQNTPLWYKNEYI